MKKIISLALVFAIALTCAFAFSSCGNSKIKIAVPNDTTNEARALMLLETQGLIKLREGAGITATIRDIVENPYDIEFSEVEAAQLPNVLKDVDFAVINSNYAIAADLSPKNDTVAIEGSASAYTNIIAVKEGRENDPIIKALCAALESKAVADYISETYNGDVVCVVDNPGDGYAADVDYDALAGKTIKVAASPAPHSDILKVAKEILAARNITLEIGEFQDYVVPNTVVEDGSYDANYFQHTPYLTDFNAEKGTHLVSAAEIHVEPMGIYSTNHKSLDEIKK